MKASNALMHLSPRLHDDILLQPSMLVAPHADMTCRKRSDVSRTSQDVRQHEREVSKMDSLVTRTCIEDPVGVHGEWNSLMVIGDLV